MPAAPRDDSPPIAIETFARSSPESAPLPSAQTRSRCTGARRRQTESRQTVAVVSSNHFPSVPAGILPASRTIAGLDAPPTSPWPPPFLSSRGTLQFHALLPHAAPVPTPRDTAAAI